MKSLSILVNIAKSSKRMVQLIKNIYNNQKAKVATMKFINLDKYNNKLDQAKLVLLFDIASKARAVNYHSI